MNENALNDLEPQQFQRLYWESDVPMKDLRVGLLEKVLIFMTLAFVGLLVTSATVRFPDQLELPFVLKSEQQHKVYTFPFKVYVQERYVHSGNKIKANQALVKITSPEIVKLIHQLNTDKSKENKFQIADKIGYEKQREIVRYSIVQSDIQIENLQTQLKLLEKNWQIEKQKLEYELSDSKEKIERNKPLFEGKYISQVEFRQLELNLVKAQTALHNAQIEYNNKESLYKSQIAELQISKTSSNSTTDKIKAEERSSEIQLKSDYTNTLQMFENLFGNYEIQQGSIIIKSTNEGQIAYLFDGDLEVKESMVLLKISAEQSQNYAFIKCSPSVMGKIKLNQECRLKVTSFPFYEWGTLNGKLTEMSAAPDENGEFNLKINFDNTSKMQPLLHAGLTGDAVVIIENKTLLQYFFRGSSKTYHQLIQGDLLKKNTD